MSETILVGKSAQEWFREMVADVASSRRLQIKEVTEFYLVNLLAKHHGNISQAARRAGIDRKTIHRMLVKYDLEAS